MTTAADPHCAATRSTLRATSGSSGSRSSVTATAKATRECAMSRLPAAASAIRKSRLCSSKRIDS
eukprot:scaffold36926_cov63-Phaeocystis_antarctica.AAC.5